MIEFSFTVPIAPVAQPRARATSIGGMVRMYEPRSTGTKGNRKPHPIIEYKQSIRDAAMAHCKRPLQGPLVVNLTFWMPRVQLDRKKTGLLHAKKPDIDNLMKSTFDALNGIAWRDDAQVWSVMAEKRICDVGQEPRVFVHCYETEVVRD